MAKTKQRSDTSSKSQFNNKPRKVSKAASKGTYKSISYESFEELSFLYWAFELKNQGYIKSIRRSEGFLLSDALVNDYVENLKTKSKPMSQTIMHGHSYTPEFLIIWDYKRAKDKVITLLHGGKKIDTEVICHFDPERQVCYSYVEIKPMWDQNNMERLFRINMKWMWQKHNIYVNLIKPQDLFSKTFTPKEYLVTPGGQQRKIKWRVRTLFDFLNK